jgi:homoserine O-acetyltransferase
MDNGQYRQPNRLSIIHYQVSILLRVFHSSQPFPLECGVVLPEIELAYRTYGELNAARDNAVWVCHALTGSADAADWWSGLVGEGRLFDPRRQFIVCANVLGSAYGSTSALSVNPLTGQPYYHDFPVVTMRDVVGAFDRLRRHLGLDRIRTCIGGSLGGQQAVEWAVAQPELFEQLILIATNARMSPWGVAFNESQRMAIAADSTWTERRPDAGLAGLKAARATALLSYRNYETYNRTQTRGDGAGFDGFRASSYQQYQGQKLVSRFNAFAYWSLTKLMDSHDVGRGRGTLPEALARIQARTLVLGIKSDVLFPIEEQRFLRDHIAGAELTEIDSLYGHDGFLIENELITKTIRAWEFVQALDAPTEKKGPIDRLFGLFREKIS